MTYLDRRVLEAERSRYEQLLDRHTGLPKWELLFDRTATALARARRNGLGVAVFVLGDPKLEVGRTRIRAVVDALRERLRTDDTVARIGEHRLAVLCNEIREDEDAALVARRLVYGAGIACSLGVALATPEDTPRSLLGRALAEAAKTAPAV